MTAKEIKKAIRDKKLDRRKIADVVGVSYQYLTQILNGFVPLKADMEKKLEGVVK
jgi:transcriptional regulator with XRE-family HTH domain